MIWFVCTLAILSVQAQKFEYRIVGKAPGAADGDTVKVLHYDGWYVKTDTQTVVKDEAFSIVGKLDTACMRYLNCHTSSDKNLMSEIILEAGEIHVTLTDNSSEYQISGTPANEAWCAYHNRLEKLCGESLDYYHAWCDTTRLAAERKELYEKMERKDTEIIDFRLDFCRKNIERPSGIKELESIYNKIDPTEAEKLITRIPSSLMTSNVEKIKKQLIGKRMTVVGNAVLDFSLPTPDGNILSVNEVAKKCKVLLIDFWASWCGPCRAEMPEVKALYERYHEKGLEILGVSLDNDAIAWKNAIAQIKLPWLQVSDLKGWNSVAASLYGVTAIPATVLVVDGKIVARGLRGEGLANKIADFF